MKFKGKIIISDIDGTYTGSADGVRKNNEAIEYFKSEGGLFTFATGRVEYSVKSVVPDFFELTNAPAVMSNGSYLYDVKTDTRINEICVDASYALPFLKGLKDEMPDIGIRINRGKGYMTPEINPAAYKDLKNYISNVKTYDFDDMPTDGWNKIVLVGSREQVTAASEYVRENGGYEKFAVSFSCPTLLELLDPAATKGNQVRYMKKMLGDYTTYCCGDFENDEDMLKKADFAVVPSSGMDKIVAIADIVTCHCMDGTIAYLVDMLDKEKDSPSAS